MPVRKLPVRPDLRQLKRQAKDLLKSIRRGDPEALEELHRNHPRPPAAADAQLADAQLVLARSYQATSWTRLVRACEMIDAIWRDDVDRVMQIVTAHPEMIHEHATIRDSNWGPPMTYAANLGRDRIIRMLHRLGARDTEWALGRAVLQGKIATARMLHEMLGSPEPPEGALAGAAYTLSVSGTAFAFEIGARIVDANGKPDGNAIEHLLGTDSRNPAAKHRILELYVEHGLEPPDTPVMALHRGRVDLLQAQLDRDPELLTRTFPVTDLFPPELGCRTDVFRPPVAQGTPIHGTTLLHIAAYFDELDVAEWLLDRGMDPDAPAAVDEIGFGGYTALFSTVVSQHNFWVNYQRSSPDDARFTRLLLDCGADPNVRASIRHGFEEGHGGGPVREYRDVTPLGWGEGFPEKVFVSRESVRLIEGRGGRR
jgi:hypothetical protein